jgi:hypothetical protein
VAKVIECGMICGRATPDGRGMRVIQGRMFGGMIRLSKRSESRVEEVRNMC